MAGKLIVRGREAFNLFNLVSLETDLRYPNNIKSYYVKHSIAITQKRITRRTKILFQVVRFVASFP